MVMFQFFKMAAVAILDFQNFDSQKGHGVKLRQVTKFRVDRSNVTEIWQFFDFSSYLGF